VIWSKKLAAGVAFAIVSSLVAMGCSEGSSGYDDPRRIVDAEQVPETKRIRRLTADQLFASLEVATGQRWDDQEQFAATLGRPDFAEVTVEGREMSVGFAKLAGDAARETCRRAVEQDRNTADAAARTILRRIGSTEQLDPFDPSVGDNLRYLLLRFHGVYATDDDDRRLQPWFTLLQDGLSATDEGRFAEAEDRWIAVCTGLALHPDFLTY
jgi:hypothetical protein